MKKILVFTAGYGEGHNTAARNIAAGVNHLGGEALVIDPFAVAHPESNDFVRRCYLTAINRFPRVWQAIYILLDRTDLVPWTRFLMRGASDVIEAHIRREKPDAVCSTYPVYNFLLEKLRHRPGMPPFLQTTCVTDSISVNSLWYKAWSDLFFVPNEDTAAVMRERGKVEEARLHVTGFPVQLAFALPERRLEAAACDGSRCKVLYMINSGRAQAPRMIDRLLADPRVALTVSVGREEQLARLTEERARKAGRTIEVLGWTDRMPEMLMTHHLLVTKAGGATVQEALAAGIPLLINQVVPGQEEGNYELIRRLDGGVLIQNPREAAAAIDRALSGGARVLNTWRDNIRRHSQPDAALEIAARLLK